MTESRNGSAQDRWRLLAFQTWAVIGVLLLLYAAGMLLGRISSALVPFAFGAVIVVILRGPVQWLQSRGIPRVWAVALCFLVGLALFAALLVFIIPTLVNQVAAFIEALPGYVNSVYNLWNQLIHPSGKPLVPTWFSDAIVNAKDSIVKSLGSWSTSGLGFVVEAGSQAVTMLINGVLALIIGFYTLMDLEKLRAEALSLVPTKNREEAGIVLSTVSRVLGGWLRGALIDSLIVGALIAGGLTVLGVPYGVAIGIIGGLFNVVPYLGPTVAAVLAGIAGFFSGDPLKALWAVLVVVVVQQFDSLWLNPRIMSKNVDLHPLLVVFSLLTGASLFGVPGLLLAVPVAAIVKGLFVWFFERRTRRDLRTEDGALFKMPPGGAKEVAAEVEQAMESDAGAGAPAKAGSKAERAAEEAEEETEEHHRS